MREARGAIVVVTYRREQVMVDTLRSILAQAQADIEVVVIDQTEMHEPTTVEQLRWLTVDYSNLRVFRVTPPSIGAARNFGVAMTSAPLIIFFDDDVILHRGCIEAHLDAHAAYPRVGGTVGRVDHPGQDLAEHLYQMDRFGNESGGFNWQVDGRVTTLNGANMAFKRSALMSVGCFDPSFTGNGWREESDVATKLENEGWELRFVASAYLTHLANPSGGARAFGSDYYGSPDIYQNETIFVLRRGMPIRLLPVFFWRLARRGFIRRPSLRDGTIVTRLIPFVVGVARGVRLSRRPLTLEAREVG